MNYGLDSRPTSVDCFRDAGGFGNCPRCGQYRIYFNPGREVARAAAKSRAQRRAGFGAGDASYFAVFPVVGDRIDRATLHRFGAGNFRARSDFARRRLFLLAKATFEIHENLEGERGHASAKVTPTFTSVIVQIFLLDAVFSLDSVITAIGMVEQIEIMIAAVVVAVAFMMFFAGAVSRFVQRHPTIKMLALSFLLLIGLTLIVESFDVHIPKGYIYFAMGFSVFVEMLNLRLRRKSEPVSLHERYVADSGTQGS